MIVKNLFVNEVDIYIDELLKELIKNEISYVKIDNEIHFDNYIIRLYDKNEVIRLFNESLNDKEGVFTFLNDVSNEYKKIDINLPNYNDKYFKGKLIESPNKKNIKKQNKLTNKLIKTKK